MFFFASCIAFVCLLVSFFVYLCVALYILLIIVVVVYVAYVHCSMEEQLVQMLRVQYINNQSVESTPVT